ncbi:MAG: hypothetical protein IJO65_09990 [Lachnospiraceae bacterium]|nr:hypothetical protein [Lachnospiraceae bacterium]
MITIHAMGDSLVTAYGEDENNFIGGWGDHLQSFFCEEKVKVNVYAQGGRSSRSFLNEGRFVDTGIFTVNEFPYNMGPVCNRIKPGDYVLMQFCHNDDNSKDKLTYIDRMTPLGEPDAEGRYPTVVPTEEMKVSTASFPEEYPQVLIDDGATQKEIEENRKKYEEILPAYGDTYYPYACGATYKGYLKFYIDKVRELGAIPVLITAPARQYFEGGKIVAVPGHHGNKDAFGDFPYVRAVRQLGVEENVAVADLFRRSCELLEMLGSEDAQSLHSIKDENGLTIGEARYDRPRRWIDEYDRCWREQLFSDVDNTHQNRFGSYLYAAALTDCLYEQIPELKAYVLAESKKVMSCPERIKGRVPEIEAMIKRIRVR